MTDDSGNAVAEFAMVMVFLILLFLSLIQVGLHLYTRIQLTAAAAATARYAANADVTTYPATEHVAGELSGLVGATRASLSCQAGTDGPLVAVTCTMQSPGIVGLLDGIMPTITITGHAAREQ